MSKFASVGEYFKHVAAQQATRTEEKPVVKYHVASSREPTVGYRHSVIAVDHPAEYLNGQVVSTSPVQSVDGTSFETLNTRYELAE
jgi:hypothetical protein